MARKKVTVVASLFSPAPDPPLHQPASSLSFFDESDDRSARSGPPRPNLASLSPNLHWPWLFLVERVASVAAAFSLTHACGPCSSLKVHCQVRPGGFGRPRSGSGRPGHGQGWSLSLPSPAQIWWSAHWRDFERSYWPGRQRHVGSGLALVAAAGHGWPVPSQAVA